MPMYVHMYVRMYVHVENMYISRCYNHEVTVNLSKLIAGRTSKIILIDSDSLNSSLSDLHNKAMTSTHIHTYVHINIYLFT